MAFHITPSLGVDLTYNSTELPYGDRDGGVPTPPLGTKVVGSDGHEYVFVQASAAIAANTDVDITEPAFTAATAAATSDWETQGEAIADEAYFWARNAVL